MKVPGTIRRLGKWYVRRKLVKAIRKKEAEVMRAYQQTESARLDVEVAKRKAKQAKIDAKAARVQAKAQKILDKYPWMDQ